MISSTLLQTTDQICEACQGQCWDPKDNFKTQKNVRKKYGIISDKCVLGSDGKVHCQYSKWHGISMGEISICFSLLFLFYKNFRLGVRVFNSEKIGIEDPSPNPDFLHFNNQFIKLRINIIFKFSHKHLWFNFLFGNHI